MHQQEFGKYFRKKLKDVFVEYIHIFRNTRHSSVSAADAQKRSLNIQPIAATETRAAAIKMSLIGSAAPCRTHQALRLCLYQPPLVTRSKVAHMTTAFTGAMDQGARWTEVNSHEEAVATVTAHSVANTHTKIQVSPDFTCTNEPSAAASQRPCRTETQQPSSI